MLNVAERIAEVSAAQLGLPDAAPPSDADAGALDRVLCDLEDPGLAPSTFTDIALAVLFALSRRHAAQTLLVIGAYQGVGARALTVGRLSALRAHPDGSVEEVLSDPNGACLPHLRRHRDACLAALGLDGASDLDRNYNSTVTSVPSPDVIARMPQRSGYTALVDLDDSARGKAGYTEAARALLDLAPRPGLMIFHDVCVPRFAHDMKVLKALLAKRDIAYMDLPVDECGIGAAYAA